MALGKDVEVRLGLSEFTIGGLLGAQESLYMGPQHSHRAIWPYAMLDAHVPERRHLGRPLRAAGQCF